MWALSVSTASIIATRYIWILFSWSSYFSSNWWWCCFFFIICYFFPIPLYDCLFLMSPQLLKRFPTWIMTSGFSFILIPTQLLRFISKKFLLCWIRFRKFIYAGRTYVIIFRSKLLVRCLKILVLTCRYLQRNIFSGPTSSWSSWPI